MCIKFRLGQGNMYTVVLAYRAMCIYSTRIPNPGGTWRNYTKGVSKHNCAEKLWSIFPGAPPPRYRWVLPQFPFVLLFSNLPPIGRSGLLLATPHDLFALLLWLPRHKIIYQNQNRRALLSPVMCRWAWAACRQTLHTSRGSSREASARQLCSFPLSPKGWGRVGWERGGSISSFCPRFTGMMNKTQCLSGIWPRILRLKLYFCLQQWITSLSWL